MVLVILAILAAILVPALLGWIDKAREKQYVLDARSVYVATQAYIDEQYAHNPADVPDTGTAGTGAELEEAAVKEIRELADVYCTGITIKSYEPRVDTTAKVGEIKEMEITGLGATTTEEGTPTGGVTATLGEDGWEINDAPAGGSSVDGGK